MKCVFCEQQEIRDREIFRDRLVRCFPTNIPIVPGHTLVCPVRHVSKIDELTSEELKALFDLVRKLKTTLTKIFKAEGFNYAWNEGEIAGQSIPHLHLHVLPRKKGDKGVYKHDPRKFLYRPGSRVESPQEELLEIAKLIKENF